MQKVISVPNADFTVPPVTSIAQTIINRRWIKFPINTSGKYSHLKNTSLPSTIYTDWGDNENIVDLQNTHLEFDMTASWMDTDAVTVGANKFQVASPFLTPGFDQSSQALINRLRIGTSQGMEIEQIQSYNKISNMIQGYTQTTVGKDYHLTNESRFRKSLYHERGQSEMVGDALYEASDTGGPPHGVQKRMVLRLQHSSFFNRVKMLPLFLFRNGIRVEVDFEDVNRAFTYECSHSSPMLNGIGIVPQFRLGPASSSAAAGSTIPTWMVLPGTISMDGKVNASPNVAAAANAINIVSNWSCPQAWKNCFIGPPRVGGNADAPNDLREFDADNSVTDQSQAFQTFIPTGSVFSQFKNMLYLSKEMVVRMITNVAGLESSYQHLSGYQRLAMGIPVTIFENGQMKFRGFIMLPADQSALENYAVFDESGVTHTFLFPNTSQANPSYLSQPYERRGTGVGGIGADNEARGYFKMSMFPMFAWDHVYSPSTSLPYKCFSQHTDGVASPNDVIQYISDAYDLRAGLHLDFDNYFFFSTAANIAQGNGLTGSTSGGLNWTPPDHFARDPRIIDLWANPAGLTKLGKTILQWDYTVENIEWRMSLIKPSSDVFTQFTTAFQKDIGIPYPFTRIFQFSRTLVGAPTGVQQIQIPLSVRSLNSVLISLSDPLFTTYNQSSPQRMFIPMLSTFQRRGLSKLELVAGGMHKPEYRLQLDPKQGVTQIPLLENFFGLDGMTSFNPSFHKMFLGLTRNIAASGNVELTAENIKSSWDNVTKPETSISGVDPKSQTLTYSDSSRFLWGLNLAKKDTQGFASGLDTSMSGSLNLNLYFAQDAAPTRPGEVYDSGKALNRQCQVDIICFADALFTAQNDANLIRW